MPRGPNLKPLVGHFREVPCRAKPASVSGWARKPEGVARSPLSGRELARRNGKGLCANRRQAIPGLAGFRGSAQRPRTISTQSRKGRRARKDFLGRALAKPVRERPWLKSYLWRDQPRTITDALRLRLRKFPRGGATAPDQGNCRGRASRGRDEPDATLKRASCVVIPVARPSAAPGRLGNRLRRSRKFLEAQEVDNFPSFPMLRSSFSNPAGRPEALRSHAAAGETQFQPDETCLCRMRTAHPPASFPKSAR